MMRVGVAFLLASVAWAAQVPFFSNLDNFPAPEQELGALSSEQFTTFSHPAFPKHSVRIKQLKDLCDNKSKSYSGYIDVEARHLFFYFFESRSSPDEDPVVMWINGGPGCSSSLGAFMELGPCNIYDEHGPKYNPHAWNTKANLFFLDQPIGVGFSYASHGESVGTTEDAAVDIAAFVTVFFETFSKFEGREFHLSGESFAGRYLPVFASAVYDANAVAVAQGRKPINLASVLIGNGITDTETMLPSYYAMTCTAASVEPFLPISACVRMKQALPRCQKWFKANCVDQFDAISCTAAATFCEIETGAPLMESGRNPYNIAEPCDGSVETTLCYPLTKHINNWLDQPDVRAMLGVSHKIGNFTSCSGKVGAAFGRNLDGLHSSKDYVAELLERGVRVLVYVGNYDWICNWIGNLAWTNALEWTHGSSFASKDLVEWKVDGERAGQTKSAAGLTYATVEKAGHMVPYDRPVQALAMLNRWLAKENL